MSWFKKSAVETKTVPGAQESESRISAILSQGAIKLNMEATDKEEVFEELVDLLVQTGGVQDREAALSALRKREALMSTGIGNGVALPHGKHESITGLVAALGVSQRGVDFDCPDGKPAHLVFLLLARTDRPGPHIQALAEIAQLVQSEGFTKRIMTVKSPADVLDLIRAEE